MEQLDTYDGTKHKDQVSHYSAYSKNSRLRRHRARRALDKHCAIQEPVRTSMYDLISENLAASNRHIYLERQIYLGEHHFPEEGFRIEEVFGSVVHDLNIGVDAAHEDRITGLLLHYPRYYIHLIETSEKMLKTHFDILFRDKRINQCLKSCVLLDTVHHMKERLAGEWIHYTAVPPKLFEKLNPDTDFLDATSIVLGVVKKINNLAVRVSIDIAEERELKVLAQKPSMAEREKHGIGRKRSELKTSRSLPSYTESKGEQNEDSVSACLTINPSIHRKLTIQVMTNPYRDFLIEIETLEFLNQANFLKDLKAIHDIYTKIPQAVFLDDLLWPIETDFIPVDLFDDLVDPVPNLPQDIALEQDEEESLLAEEFGE